MKMIGKKFLLIWDQHESHKTPLVKNYLRSLGHKFLYVPARGTDYLQPCDVSINKPFKSHMRGMIGTSGLSMRTKLPEVGI